MTEKTLKATDVEMTVLTETAVDALRRPYIAIYIPVGMNVRVTDDEVLLGPLEGLDEAEVIE